VHNKIKESWGKIEPSSATHERMLNNILRQKHEIKLTEASLNHQQERMKTMTPSPFWKIFAPIAACALVALIVAVPLMMHSPSSPDNGIVLGTEDTDPEYEAAPSQNPDNIDDQSQTTIPAPINPIQPQVYELIFNELPESFGTEISGGSRLPAQIFWHDIPNDKAQALLPGFYFTTPAVAMYLYDGSLQHVSASVVVIDAGEYPLYYDDALTNFYVFSISIAPNPKATSYIFDFEPIISYVDGVPVEAVMRAHPQIYPTISDFIQLQANFELDGVYYNVVIIVSAQYSEHGQDRLTEVVNTIIRNGPADLSILADPVIPELRNDALTLEEALTDPEFGSFLPAYIPHGLGFGDAIRIVEQHSSSLRINWHEPWQSSVSWGVFASMEHHYELIVSVEEREKFDLSLYTIPWMDSVPWELINFVSNPVFLAEDMTLEIVQARVLESGRAGGWENPSIRFNVMFDGVVVSVDSSGLSAEVVWAMLEGLL